MAAPTSGSVMLQAACHLNDASQLVYTSVILLPFLNMALQELDEELGVYGVSPFTNESIVIDVDIDDTVLAQMPTDYVEAVSLFERLRDSSDEWIEVKEYNWIDPNLDDSEQIMQWASRGGAIRINTPTTEREVLLHYIKAITAATGSGTTIDIATSVRLLALLTARNAARDLGNAPTKANMYEMDISRARDRLVRRLSNEQQGMGVRRRPFVGR